eukprot:3220461-Alexandrium_andersonii.AAC.1
MGLCSISLVAGMAPPSLAAAGPATPAGNILPPVPAELTTTALAKSSSAETLPGATERPAAARSG